MIPKAGLLYVILLFLIPGYAVSQTGSFRLNPGLVQPKDSLARSQLLTALQSFLAAGKQPNNENRQIGLSYRAETYLLLDEWKDIEQNETLKDASFYKPYLTNIVALPDSAYLIQLSYTGTKRDTALLRANFSVLAHKAQNSFVFSSPLLNATRNWKVRKQGNFTFHYQNTLNRKKAKEYSRLASSFDKKLGSPVVSTGIYCTSGLTEGGRLIGMDYKADYNGMAEGTWSSSADNRETIVLGDNNADFSHFDPHDLFHDRLSLVIPRNKVNRPVDEGCAYLYGGSWGLSWHQVFTAFREQVASDSSVNWAAVKEKPLYFKTNGFRNAADYIVNALLVQKIEKEKGFAGVWQLLNVGPFEKGNEKYYARLEMLTGITKSGYNQAIWKLIQNQP